MGCPTHKFSRRKEQFSNGSDAIRFDGSDAYVLEKKAAAMARSIAVALTHCLGITRNVPPLAAVHVRGQREAAAVISDVSLCIWPRGPNHGRDAAETRVRDTAPSKV